MIQIDDSRGLYKFSLRAIYCIESCVHKILEKSDPCRQLHQVLEFMPKNIKTHSRQAKAQLEVLARIIP